jgi:HlyD family secretion protein
VVIETGRREEVLRVPTAALRFRPPADTREGASTAAGTSTLTGTGTRPERSPGARREHAAAGDGTTGGDASRIARDGTGDDRAGRVWTLDGPDPEPVRITTGLSDDQYTEVVSGPLREGQSVIVAVDRPVERTATTGAQPPGVVQRGGGRRGR